MAEGVESFAHTDREYGRKVAAQTQLQFLQGSRGELGENYGMSIADLCQSQISNTGGPFEALLVAIVMMSAAPIFEYFMLKTERITACPVVAGVCVVRLVPSSMFVQYLIGISTSQEGSLRLSVAARSVSSEYK